MGPIILAEPQFGKREGRKKRRFLNGGTIRDFVESCLRHRCSQPMAIDFHLQEKQGRPLNPSQGGLCSTLLPLIPSEVYYLLSLLLLLYVGMHDMHDVCM